MAALSARFDEGRLLSIGQVLAQLSPEFPDISPSKLRFLEERGLVSPARTQSGYRKFSNADVERLRLVLAMQRDCYLPLNVIKQYLHDVDAGLNPAMPGGTSATVPSMLGGARRLSRDDLLAETRATPQLLNDAVSASLVTASETYGDDAVGVLKAMVELQKVGIEPRHLRGFRAAADREVGLIESALLPVARRNTVSSRAQIADRASEISAQLEIVRTSLIRSALGKLAP
ncbi:transcriptional regulator FtsR [Subtercola boreus]|uniref:MerR family transcriptional regulator n=1 Tax=Subtercola boreus TaxID=120213 RepID=A0A3E0WDS9_9MICO|nr:MerR family transcriptional regulator [Subtercola boreus]RFA21077.1 MerR family transcriptional regulator [Subtercola boreus]RFA21461.1 MerR family transcriptional regulator [Subtercola boreus]RFA27432.1 MerR family transcriptional regulator [Subtercola boreus]